MEKNKIKAEQGQSLVLIAVIMIVLIGLAALAIDGGFALSNRRKAQNAADAGALAGANALCAGNIDQAEPQAMDYAINRNNATAAEVIVTSGAVTVTAFVPQNTFLAGIFGTDVVTTTASASAGCYSPCNITGVLPVAWLCENPPEEGRNDCGIQYGNPGQDPPIYIVMDSLKTGIDTCQDPPNSGLPAGALDCDLNDDGVNELKSGGDRSWLDLDGSGGGSNQLKDWVWNGFGGQLTIHTWYAGQSGTANDVFQAVGDIVNSIVWLPVFDTLPCNGRPDINCPSEYHTNPPDEWQDQIILSPSTSQMYFHVITFSAFKITCVEAPGIPGNPDCPGKNAAIAANPQIPENTKSIEGYFVEDTGGSGKCDGPDAGVHTIYLNH